jgi:P-type Cu+ transporter
VQTVCLLYGCQCNACCERIERALRRVAGVRDVEVNLYKATATVEHDSECAPQGLVEAVERAGYLASLADPVNRGRSPGPDVENGGRDG